MKTGTDIIELKMPFKAEYVSIARLTASGIASRIGFDIDTVEDIKVALAEVCNKLLGSGIAAEYYSITFKISASSLDIVFHCDDKSAGCIFGEEDSEFGLSIIAALMDKVEFCPDNDYLLYMSKTLEVIG